MEEYEDKLESDFYMNMDPVHRLGERFPWLDAVEQITADQGFFHWELRFASVFADGGFDLQVGNPPWVQPQWDESGVLAELEPWFELTEKPPISERAKHMEQLLSAGNAQRFVLKERAAQAGVAEFISSIAVYPLLVGTKPDFYRAFMIRSWRNIGFSGVVGLLHPDTHFVGDAERFLRAEAYSRLRIHGGFVNSGNRFFAPPVSRTAQFGIHVYSNRSVIDFAHLSWLLDSAELPKSLALAEVGELPDGWDQKSVPGVKYMGDWDARPHPARVIRVNSEILATWRLILGKKDQQIEYTKLLSPVTTLEQGAVVALGRVKQRLGSFHAQMSRGLDEGSAKRTGLIRWETWDPTNWSEAILKGPQIGVATPFFKQPPNTGTKGRPQDLAALPTDALPRAEYVRAADLVTYEAAKDLWMDSREPGRLRPYTDFFRLVWRRMIPDNTDRSLFAALIPPGATHIDGIFSMTMPSNHETALVSGLWSSLPFDYILRITGLTNLHTSDAQMMPMPASDAPLAIPLLLRALRLNCLTTAYADLWAELYNDAWRDETWTVAWPNIAPLGNIGPTWERVTPLRTEYERRAALVEIDALVAVWLGITEEQLEAIYPARYPVLGDYEDVSWYDATGRKLAGNWNTFGTGQTKEHWQQFQAYQEDQTKNPPPDGYQPPFYKADRIAEYRQAHAAFTGRMKEAAS
jgi:hypothetical protein